MSVTSFPPRSPEQALAPEDRDYLQLRRLYDAIGDGPWSQQSEFEPGSLHNRILDVTRSRYRDYATAGVSVAKLVQGGFLTARQDGRHTVYTKAAKLPEPDRRTWVERQQAVLDAAHRADEERLNTEYENAQRVAEQRKEMDGTNAARQALVLQVLRDAGFIDQLKALIRDEVRAALQEETNG